MKINTKKLKGKKIVFSAPYIQGFNQQDLTSISEFKGDISEKVVHFSKKKINYYKNKEVYFLKGFSNLNLNAALIIIGPDANMYSYKEGPETPTTLDGFRLKFDRDDLNELIKNIGI